MCTYIHVYTYISTCSVYTYLACMYTYVCTYVCIYTYTHTPGSLDNCTMLLHSRAYASPRTQSKASGPHTLIMPRRFDQVLRRLNKTRMTHSRCRDGLVTSFEAHLVRFISVLSIAKGPGSWGLQGAFHRARGRCGRSLLCRHRNGQ